MNNLVTTLHELCDKLTTLLQYCVNNLVTTLLQRCVNNLVTTLLNLQHLCYRWV